MPRARASEAAPAEHVVRPAARGDVGGVATVERAAFADPWSADSFAALLSNPAVWFAVLERRGSAAERAIAGYVVAWFAADEGEIANVALEPASRGRGLGARLVDAALEEAARRGAATVYLEVRESNAAARALYASRAFAVVGRRRRYYRHPPEDALVMARAMGPGTYAPPGLTRNESAQGA